MVQEGGYNFYKPRPVKKNSMPGLIMSDEEGGDYYEDYDDYMAMLI